MYRLGIKTLSNMIKILLTIAFALLSIEGIAQIPNSLFGLTLGESTKEEVLKVAESKNMHVMNRGDKVYLTSNRAKTMTIYGFPWDCIVCEFYQGQLMLVSLGAFSNDGIGDQSILERYNSLTKLYDERYESYKSSSSEKRSQYQSGDTKLSISLSPDQANHNQVFVNFYSVRLVNLKK